MMTHRYRVTGMTCDHCVYRVRDALQSIPGVISVEVTLVPPVATVVMHHHISTDRMNEALSQAGDYSLEMESHDELVGQGHSKHKQRGGHNPQSSEPVKTSNSDHSMHKGHETHEQMTEKMNHSGHEGHSGQSGKMDHSAHGEMGHDHHRMMIEDFKKRFWVSLVLAIPILALSPMIQHWMGVNWAFPGSRFILFTLSSIVYFYGGWPFLQGLYDELRQKAPGMMTLIAMAISVAYFYSAATTFGLPGEDFFWELATLIVIMLLGHWIEMKSVLGASKALELLVSMMPSEAHKVDGDNIIDIKLEALLSGDTILVKPGEKVPADGVIVEGESYLNEAMLTGESKPAKKVIHDNVIGGSINGNSTYRKG